MNETTPVNSEAKTASKPPRRHYDAAFRQSAVAHCQRHGGEIHRTAQELGLNHWTLRDWVQADRRAKQPPRPARGPAELEAENVRLSAELVRVTAQRDILKKSLGIRSLS